MNCSKYHRQLLKTVWNCDVSKITYSFHIRHVHLIPSTIWIKWSILTVQCWIYCSQRVRPNAWFYSCEEDIPFFRLFSYHFSLNWKPKCAALKNFVRIVHGRKVLCLNLHMTYIPNESERGSLLILRSTAWTIHSQHSRLDLNSLTNCMQEITYTPPATANSSEFGERKKQKTQRKRRRVIFYYDLSCAVCVCVCGYPFICLLNNRRMANTVWRERERTIMKEIGANICGYSAFWNMKFIRDEKSLLFIALSYNSKNILSFFSFLI